MVFYSFGITYFRLGFCFEFFLLPPKKHSMNLLGMVYCFYREEYIHAKAILSFAGLSFLVFTFTGVD